MDNTELIKREVEARVKDEADARAILDKASEEKRSTSPEEDEQFDKFVTSSEVRKNRIDKLVKLSSDSDGITEAVRSLVSQTTDSGSGSGADAPESLNRRIIETVRMIADAKDKGGEVEKEYNLDQPFDMEAIRAISDFANSTSLYVSDFSTNVAIFQRTMSPWISQATVINSNNGRPLILPNVTADPTSYSNGEGTAITASDPTLGTATATPKSYKALGYVSQEAEEDELVGLMQIISKTQGRALGLAFGTDATAAVLSGGTNGGTATGLGGAGAASNVLGTATFVGYEDLLDLKYGIAAPYRLVGAWVMANGMIKKARKYRDAQGQYLWTPAIAVGQPDTFDGQAVYEDPGLAAPASITKSVVYGDLSAFVIKQMALRVAVSSDFKFDTDQISIKAVYRAAGAVQDAAALRYLISANT